MEETQSQQTPNPQVQTMQTQVPQTQVPQKQGGKSVTIILIIFVVLLLLAGLGFGGWYFFIRKAKEGEACSNDSKCAENLKCLNKICSSGGIGSSCEKKSDCTTNYCVNNICTEGKSGDECSTYKDCQKGLFCTKSICSEPPSYSEYFDKIIVAKIKPGSPPGPNNIPVPTTEFLVTDGFELDFVGVKSTTVGYVYYEFVDSVSGETLFSSEFNKQKLEGDNLGMGSDFPKGVEGELDLMIYFNDEVVYSVPITVSR